jgi:nickel-dependent lactate racemase
LEAAHEAGCAETAKLFRIGIEEPVDALITSAGGWPYDCSFMQALKAVFNVQEVVRTGGSVLWIARSEEGMKKDFLRWGCIESDEEMESAVRANYNLTGHNSIMLRQLVRRLRVAFWSDLPDEEVRTMGLHPVHSLEEGIDWLVASLPQDFQYAVAPFANVTCATLDAQGG